VLGKLQSPTHIPFSENWLKPKKNDDNESKIKLGGGIWTKGSEWNFNATKIQ
jgi:hypothetical protein